MLTRLLTPVVYRLGMPFFYTHVAIPSSRVRMDVPYVEGSGNRKQAMNFFFPRDHGWPVAVFVHGGSWDSGDKDLRVGGADVYNNVGRFLAARGVGAAVISYRLQPSVPWEAQADDVRMAARRARQIALEAGGSGKLFFVGHSAGAHLGMHAALNADALDRIGVPHGDIIGIVAVSGAGYDLTDFETYRLGNNPKWYARRFQKSPSDEDWMRRGSPVRFVRPDAPESLVMYSEGETAPLKRQAFLMHEALDRAGARTSLVGVHGRLLTHSRIVATLSRTDRPAGAALAAFTDRMKER